MIGYLFAFLVFVCSYPSAILLYRLTKDEKKIYKKYFIPILFVLAIFAIIFSFLDLIIALTLVFLFLTIFFWNRF